MPFVEALRQFQFRVGELHLENLPISVLLLFQMKSRFYMMVFAGAENFCLVHVSLVPVIGVVGEQVQSNFVFLIHVLMIICFSMIFQTK